MTTSNKLLLGFTGVLVLFMLFSAIILKANYNKGITNIEGQRQTPDPDYKKATLPSFKSVVINSSASSSSEGATVLVRESKEYALEFYKNTTFSVSGDTLYLELTRQHDIVLLCPTLSYINNKSNYNINIADIKAPQLEIHSGAAVRTFVSDIQTRSFSYTGGKNNTLEINENTKLDTVRIAMEKNGSLYFYAPYKFGEFKVDSLNELNLAGKSIQSLKQMN